MRMMASKMQAMVMVVLTLTVVVVVIRTEEVVVMVEAWIHMEEVATGILMGEGVVVLHRRTQREN